MTKVLVTGATGLIGSEVVDLLLSLTDGTDVYAAGRDENRAKARFGRHAGNERFHFVKYDVRTALEGDETYDVIIHSASGATPSQFATDPVGVMMANIEGTKNLLDYGAAHGMRRMVYISSGEVYGEPAAGGDTMWREDGSGYVNCMTQRACYPTAKRAAEALCASYSRQYGVDVVVARPCHTYGPHFTNSDNRAYAQFLRRVAEGKDIVMKSDGQQFRSWIYVKDCARAIWAIAEKGESGEAYNVADESQCVSIRELAETMAEMGGVKVVTDIPSDAEKSGYPVISRAVFDTSKLRGLGWKPEYTLRSCLKETLEIMKRKHDR